MPNNLLNITKKELVKFQWSQNSILNGFHDSGKIASITDIWSRGALRYLFVSIIQRKVLDGFVENPS